MRKILFIAIALSLVGCFVFTGEKTTTIDPKTGKTITAYEEAPIVGLAETIGGILGVGGLAAAAARMARNAARARDALMETNEEALDKADWSKIDSAASFKVLLKTAQESHKDAKLLRKHYVGWKEKRKGRV